MAKIITLSTEQTICLIVFHAQQALACIKASNFDGALTALVIAQEFLSGITSKSLPLEPQDVESTGPTDNGQKPHTEAAATLNIPKHHPAVNMAQIPSCCGTYFDHEKGPCTKCNRNDACLTLTRAFETHPLLRQNWERADHKDRTTILANVGSFVKHYCMDPEHPTPATPPDKASPKRKPATSTKDMPDCFGTILPMMTHPKAVCRSCTVAGRCAQKTHTDFHAQNGPTLTDDKEPGTTPPGKRSPSTRGRGLSHCIGTYKPASEDKVSVCTNCEISARCKRVTADLAIDSDFATWWREATVPERQAHFVKKE